jgi:hypothetical protein
MSSHVYHTFRARTYQLTTIQLNHAPSSMPLTRGCHSSQRPQQSVKRGHEMTRDLHSSLFIHHLRFKKYSADMENCGAFRRLPIIKYPEPPWRIPDRDPQSPL